MLFLDHPICMRATQWNFLSKVDSSEFDDSNAEKIVPNIATTSSKIPFPVESPRSVVLRLRKSGRKGNCDVIGRK